MKFRQNIVVTITLKVAAASPLHACPIWCDYHFKGSSCLTFSPHHLDCIQIVGCVWGRINLKRQKMPDGCAFKELEKE